MRIEMSILSALSTIALAMFCMIGTEVMIDSLSVDFSISQLDIILGIHPVWRVYAPQDILNGIGCNALAYGNVMLIGDAMVDELGVYVIAHERMHIAQFRALGFAIYPASLFLDIEPQNHITQDWSDPLQPSRTMWTPPKWWPCRWSFITLTFNKENT